MERLACGFVKDGTCESEATWNVKRYILNTNVLGYTTDFCDEHSIMMTRYYIEDKSRFNMTPIQS